MTDLDRPTGCYVISRGSLVFLSLVSVSVCGVECGCTLIVLKNSRVESTRLSPGPLAIALPARSFHHPGMRQSS